MFGNVAFSQAPFSAFAGTVYEVAVSESAVALDAVRALQGVFSTVVEVAQGTATQSARLPVSVSVLTESAFGIDAYVYFGLLRSSVFNLATTRDLYSTNAVVIASRAETALARDVESTNVSVLASRSEVATGLDSQSSFPIKPAAVSDAVTAQNTQSALQGNTAVTRETATGADAESTLAALFAATVEIAVAVDAPTTNIAVNSQLSETITGGDGGTFADANYAVRRQETATIYDQAAGRRLWEPVPDIQSPDWVPVQAAGASPWGAITDTQTPGWGIIPTTPT